MGRYATVNDVETYVGKSQLIWLSQPDRQDAESINTALVEDSISIAETTIDERMFQAKYVVPLQANFTGALDVIKRVAIQLAIWDMADGRQIGNKTMLSSLKETRNEAQNTLIAYATSASTLQAKKWFNDQPNTPKVAISRKQGRVIPLASFSSPRFRIK